MEDVGGWELRAGIKNNTRTNGCELVIKKSESPDWEAPKRKPIKNQGDPKTALKRILGYTR